MRTKKHTKKVRSPIVERMRVLGRKARQGRADAGEIAELTTLETEFYATGPTSPAVTAAPRTIFDLPMARAMWEQDARDLGA